MWTTEINTKPKKAAANLLKALKFIEPAQAKNGTPNETHCLCVGGWIGASNGILTIGSPIEDDISGCPHTKKFIEACKQVGNEMSITSDEHSLTVVSGDFRAVIPCRKIDLPMPDVAEVALNPLLSDAMDILNPLLVKDAPRAVLSSALLQSDTIVATNGKALIEFNHGSYIPQSCLIPKQCLQAIIKSKKALAWFGCSESSATFWFEDGSFIKTQLYRSSYENYHMFFHNEPPEMFEVHDEFFKAVRVIKEHSTKGRLYFEDGKVMSKETEQEASSYVIPGLPDGMVFQADLLLSIKKACSEMSFIPEKHLMFFKNDNCRGVLYAVVKPEMG